MPTTQCGCVMLPSIKTWISFNKSFNFPVTVSKPFLYICFSPSKTAKQAKHPEQCHCISINATQLKLHLWVNKVSLKHSLSKKINHWPSARIHCYRHLAWTTGVSDLNLFISCERTQGAKSILYYSLTLPCTDNKKNSHFHQFIVSFKLGAGVNN